MLIVQLYWPVEFVLECTGLLVITACRGIVQESWMFVVWTNICWIWHKVNCYLLLIPLFSLMGIFKFQFDGITKPTVLRLMTEWRLEVLNAIRGPLICRRTYLICAVGHVDIAALPGLWLCSNLSIVYYFNTILLKKPPCLPRGFRNSHINFKKRKICTVKFYENLTVYIIPNSMLILIWYFLLEVDFISFSNVKRTGLFLSVMMSPVRFK